jgi:hypothetical protein
MKKFMFTAIAMMAFSVGSMANTIDVELVELVAFVESEEVLAVDCYEVASAAETLYTILQPGNPTGAYNAFSYAYDICAATMNCPGCLKGVTIHVY